MQRKDWYYTAQEWNSHPDYRNPDSVVYLRRLGQIIDAMYDWGCNAKDPLGEFMPKSFMEEARTVFSDLKMIIEHDRSNPRWMREEAELKQRALAEAMRTAGPMMVIREK